MTNNAFLSCNYLQYIFIKKLFYQKYILSTNHISKKKKNTFILKVQNIYFSALNNP